MASGAVAGNEEHSRKLTRAQKIAGVDYDCHSNERNGTEGLDHDEMLHYIMKVAWFKRSVKDLRQDEELKQATGFEVEAFLMSIIQGHGICQRHKLI
jgi:hypothetical protein